MEHEAKCSFKAEKQLKKIDVFRIYELGITSSTLIKSNHNI